MFELWAPAMGEMSYEFGLVLSATQDLGSGSSVFSDFLHKVRQLYRNESDESRFLKNNPLGQED